jgi:hypothetical protein
MGKETEDGRPDEDAPLFSHFESGEFSQHGMGGFYSKRGVPATLSCAAMQ